MWSDTKFLSFFFDYDLHLSIYLAILCLVDIPLTVKSIRANDHSVLKPEMQSFLVCRIVYFFICLVALLDIFYLKEAEYRFFKESVFMMILLALIMRFLLSKPLKKFLTEHKTISYLYLMGSVFIFILPFMLSGTAGFKLLLLNRFLIMVIIVIAISYMFGSQDKTRYNSVLVYYKRSEGSIFCKARNCLQSVTTMICNILVLGIPFLSDGNDAFELTDNHKIGIICKLSAVITIYSLGYLYIFRYRRILDIRDVCQLESLEFDDQDDASSYVNDKNVVSIEKFYIVSAQDMA